MEVGAWPNRKEGEGMGKHKQEDGQKGREGDKGIREGRCGGDGRE